MAAGVEARGIAEVAASAQGSWCELWRRLLLPERPAAAHAGERSLRGAVERVFVVNAQRLCE